MLVADCFLLVAGQLAADKINNFCRFMAFVYSILKYFDI